MTRKGELRRLCAQLNQTQTHIITRLGRQLGKAPSAFLKLLVTMMDNELSH